MASRVLLHLLAGPAVETRLDLLHQLLARMSRPGDWLIVLESPVGCSLPEMRLPHSVRWVFSPQVTGEPFETFWARECERFIDAGDSQRILWWVSPKQEYLPFEEGSLPEGVTRDSFILTADATWVENMLTNRRDSELLGADFIVVPGEIEALQSLLTWHQHHGSAFSASQSAEIVSGLFGMPPEVEAGPDQFIWGSFAPESLLDERPLRGFLANPPEGLVRVLGSINLGPTTAVCIHYFHGRLNWSHLPGPVKPERSKLWLMATDHDALRSAEHKLRRCEIG